MSENQRLPARAARHLRWRAGRAVSVTADALRRGDRTVIMTPPVGLRFGNWLYLWLQAHARSAAGHPCRVLEAPGMDEWFARFPRLKELTISPPELRFHDRRGWDDEYRYQRFGVDYSRATLDDFVREMLAPHIPVIDDDTIVVNVRRGDYYSHEHLRSRYAFDQLGYVTEGLMRLGHASRIRLVSDDPEWCRAHLGKLLQTAADDVTYDAPGALANFLSVTGHRQLIGTNSTFSYWGGYVAQVLHADARIVVPRFHARMASGTDAYQIDPSWTIIDGHH